MIQNKEDINSQDERGCTRLHLVTKKRRPIEVFELLSLGADCNIQNNDGETPLHMAIEYGKTDLKFNLSKLFLGVLHSYGTY